MCDALIVGFPDTLHVTRGHLLTIKRSMKDQLHLKVMRIEEKLLVKGF